MGISILQDCFVLLLIQVCLSEYVAKEPMSQGAAEGERKPVLLEDVTATAAFINAAEVVVIGFFQDSEQSEVLEFLTLVQYVQDVSFGLCISPKVLSHYNVTMNTISLFRLVDKARQDLEIKDSREIDATKLTRFVRINELRWVTEYNPMTVIGLFNSTVQTHLILFTNKSSSDHVEMMDKYREAAEFFQGKILFVLVDTRAKGNDRVISYFHLKTTQLPALAIFHTLEEQQDILPLSEISLKTLKDFCNGFLQRKQKEDPMPEFKEEL